MVRDRSIHGHLAIHTGSEEVEDYKRIIEQKDLFIQKLIAKMHKTWFSFLIDIYWLNVNPSDTFGDLTD